MDADEECDPLPGDELVPHADEQVRLVEGMAHLMRRVGYEPFVAGPVFEPSAEHFPEPVRATRRSVRVLLGRLMRYAGLGEYVVEVDMFDSASPFVEKFEDGTEVASPRHTAAWFAGIDGGTARFGVDLQHLDDIEKLAGILCHEVAHAYRDVRGVVARDRLVEEELTDLTTVYLGFGIFTVNNSFVHRSQRVAGNMWSYVTRHEQLGYLGPERFAFLLALQLVVRGRRRGPASRVLALLEPTQRQMAREAMRRLAPRREELCLVLGLPPEEAWPELRTCDSKAGTEAGAPVGAVSDQDDERYADDEPHEYDEPYERREEEDDDRPLLHQGVTPGINRQRVVFRLPHDQLALGALIGVVPAIMMYAAFGPLAAPVPVIVGMIWGARRVRYECSDAECGARLTIEAGSCPRCGGTVGGTLRDGKDRLAAEEEFLKDRAEKRTKERDHEAPRRSGVATSAGSRLRKRSSPSR